MNTSHYTQLTASAVLFSSLLCSLAVSAQTSVNAQVTASAVPPAQTVEDQADAAAAAVAAGAAYSTSISRSQSARRAATVDAPAVVTIQAQPVAVQPVAPPVAVQAQPVAVQAEPVAIKSPTPPDASTTAKAIGGFLSTVLNAAMGNTVSPSTQSIIDDHKRDVTRRNAAEEARVKESNKLFGIFNDENRASIDANVNEYYARPQTSGNATTEAQFCQQEMLRFGRSRNLIRLDAANKGISSGYDELQEYCFKSAGMAANRVDQQLRDQRAVADRQRQQSVEHAAQAEKARTTAQDKKLRDDLVSGKSVPETCVAHMIAKTKNPHPNLDADVMHVAYQRPAGYGSFLGKVEEISGNTFRLSGHVATGMFALEVALGGNAPPSSIPNTIVVLQSGAKVFNGETIHVGSVVEGIAVQTGSREVRPVAGAAVQLAELRAVCMAVSSGAVATR